MSVSNADGLLPESISEGSSSDILNRPAEGSGGKPFVAFLTLDAGLSPEITLDDGSPTGATFTHQQDSGSDQAYGLRLHIGGEWFATDTTLAPFSVGIAYPNGPGVCDFFCTSSYLLGATSNYVEKSFAYLTSTPVHSSLQLRASRTPSEQPWLDGEQFTLDNIDSLFLENATISVVGGTSVFVGSQFPKAFQVVGWVTRAIRIPEPQSLFAAVAGVVSFLTYRRRVAARRSVADLSAQRYRGVYSTAPGGFG